MKRIIKAAKKASKYAYNSVIQHGPIRYFAYWNEEPFEFQMSKIAPYDDAEYIWAKYKGGRWCNLYEGTKQIDHITIPLWDEKSENYEDFNEYINDVFDRVLLNLEEYNKDVDSKISHW